MVSGCSSSDWRRVPVFFGSADGRTVDVMGAGRPCARADLAPASSMGSRSLLVLRVADDRIARPHRNAVPA